MATKNYYIVLGVSTAESQNGIRARYRDLARSRHPDVAGHEATGTFQDINEAYEVLGDPGRRASHDADLGVMDRPPHSEVRITDQPSMRPPRARPEPLIPDPVSILDNPESTRPSHEALFDRFRRNFSGLRVPKHERLEGLNLRLSLDVEDAARGGDVPIGVPVFHPCRSCAGMGRTWPLPCVACQGEGLVQRERVVHVRVPPMVRAGTVIEVPLQGLGIHNFVLRLHVRVR